MNFNIVKKYDEKIDSLFDSVRLVITLFSVAIIIICFMFVMGHYISSLFQPVRWPSKLYLYCALVLSFYSRKTSIYLTLLFLPLLPTLHIQLEYFTHPAVKYFFSYEAIDVIAGMTLGQIFAFIARRNIKEFSLPVIPWPLSLLLFVLTCSAGVAIARNLWQSASSFSVGDLIANAISFKFILKTDDYYPLVDLIVFSFAVLFVCILLQELKNRKDKDNVIFAPVILGVIISAVWGIVQSITSWGLSGSSLGYRPEYLGFGAEGFQPDLHAFAGHMAVGCVGLLGYAYFSGKRGGTIFFAILLSWIALVLSKSRATLVFVFISYFIFFIIYLKQKKLSFNAKITLFILTILGALLVLIITKNYLWIYALFNTIYTADLSDLDVLDRLTSQRFELNGAAIRMAMHFPFFGIGQGTFFRLSSIYEFSGSYHMWFAQGENAHNYFLQTFAELGFIGIGCYLLVFLMPFIRIIDITKLFPAMVGVISIFLGNIFSHSLIIRENIFLLFGFIALLYAWSDFGQSDSLPTSVYRGSIIKSKTLILLVVGIILLFALREINNSFTEVPFEHGRLMK